MGELSGEDEGECGVNEIICGDSAEEIKRLGATSRGDVSVKIVVHPDRRATSPEADKYAVETVVAGDLRIPTEESMSMEEAQAFALEQLANPRAAYEPTPEELTLEPGKPVAPKRTPGPPSPEEFAHRFKARGIGRQESWSRFVQAMALRPGMDAGEWYEIYDRT